MYEVLRLFPPIGQLINRRAAQPMRLGEYVIPEGTYLGYNCYSTNRDPDAWGTDADEFLPERWGTSAKDIQKEYRQRRAKAEFISFHGGRRACLGERFALLEIKVTLFVLVRELKWTLDPSWPERMTPVRISLEKRGVLTVRLGHCVRAVYGLWLKRGEFRCLVCGAVETRANGRRIALAGAAKLDP